MRSSNVINHQTDSPISGSDSVSFNFTSDSPHRLISRYTRPIGFSAKYRDFGGVIIILSVARFSSSFQPKWYVKLAQSLPVKK